MQLFRKYSLLKPLIPKIYQTSRVIVQSSKFCNLEELKIARKRIFWRMQIQNICLFSIFFISRGRPFDWNIDFKYYLHFLKPSNSYVEWKGRKRENISQFTIICVLLFIDFVSSEIYFIRSFEDLISKRLYWSLLIPKMRILRTLAAY